MKRRRGPRLVAAAGIGALIVASAQAEMIVVEKGDSFSSIAARFVGDARHWRRLYDARLSQLPDPDLIHPGTRLELVVAGNGRRYLKALGAPPARSTATATASAAAPQPRAAAPEVAAVSTEPLTVGVLPNIAATALMAQYESVRAYFEKRANQKIDIVLPTNFKAFFDAVMRGDFDIAVSAPHFARVAQLDAGMVPLAMYEPRIGAQFIVPIGGPVSAPADVAGKTVAFANPTSLVALYGQQWLRQAGLEPGKDYTVGAARSDMGVGRQLLAGDAAAAIMSNGEYRALPPEETSRLRIVDVFARIPNFIVLGHPRLGAARLAQLARLWRGLGGDKEDGAAFVKATGFSGIVEVDEAVLRELDAYVAPTRRAMGLAR